MWNETHASTLISKVPESSKIGKPRFIMYFWVKHLYSLFINRSLTLMCNFYIVQDDLDRRCKCNHYKIPTLLANVFYQQKLVNKVRRSKYFKQATCRAHCKDAIYTERWMASETLWTWHGEASPICISVDKCCRREFIKVHIDVLL